MAELSAESERDAFREFFVKVARSQIVSPHSQFKERDCGGLVRFAYRESLKEEISFLTLTLEFPYWESTFSGLNRAALTLRK